MPAGTARDAPQWQSALHHLSSHLPEEALSTRRAHLGKKPYAAFKRNKEGKAKGATLFFRKENKKACVSRHCIPSGWSSPRRLLCPAAEESPAFPRREGEAATTRASLPFRDLGGGRTPQPGGHWRVRPTQVSAGSRARFSDVQTPPPGASGRGRLWSPSSTPGLSLLSGGAHLRPVPAAPSPRPGPRGPLGGGALGPAAVIAGPRPGRAWAAARTRSRASAGTAA